MENCPKIVDICVNKTANLTVAVDLLPVLSANNYIGFRYYLGFFSHGFLSWI